MYVSISMSLNNRTVLLASAMVTNCNQCSNVLHISCPKLSQWGLNRPCFPWQGGQGEEPCPDGSNPSCKEDSLLCDEHLFPTRKLIGERGGPASMKENICQVSP